jgi:uncharacterized membrane protein (DUF2068 family)
MNISSLRGDSPRTITGVPEQPKRFMPKFHWELLACGVDGHRLEGMDAEHVRLEDELFVREINGMRWHRCLRCDSWVPLVSPKEPRRKTPPAHEEIILPLRGKPLRDKIVLRAIAINRALHFVVLALLGIAILVFSAKRTDMHDTVVKVVADLGGGTTANGVAGHGFAHKIDELFSLQTHQLHLFALVALVYATIEGFEAVGLWFTKRWAEYLTLIVTASLLPVEIYELSHHVSPFKVMAFAINVAVVAYLMFAKRLFGIRGGVAADEELKARDVGWHALERTAPA